MTAQPLITLSGESTAPTLHIALANGFVAQTYLPLLRQLTDDYHAVCLPPRALWPDATTPPPLTQETPDWRQLADDLLAGFAAYNLSDVVAMGHSFGGIATMLAALQQPERFKALIFLDPTLLDPAILSWMQQAQADGKADEHPLAQIASRRSNAFESVDAAYERFRSKKVFAQWPDETVRLYAEYGTKPAEAGRTLTWSPEWEAFYYSTGYAGMWDAVPRLAQLDMPMLFINGSSSDTFIETSVERAREILPSARFATISGHGHLFPQSAPDETAQIVREWLASL